MNVIQQIAWLFFKPTRVDSNIFLLNFTSLGRVRDSLTVPTDLLLVDAWCYVFNWTPHPILQPLCACTTVEPQ